MRVVRCGLARPAALHRPYSVDVVALVKQLRAETKGAPVRLRW